MSNSNIPTKHAPGDADLLIVQEAVNMATTQVTHVIAEDTDVLILLCCHVKENSKPLFMVSEKDSAKHPIWSISQLRATLGNDVCRCLPFLHALCGCDTTSSLFSIGKGVVVKKQNALCGYAAPFLSS